MLNENRGGRGGGGKDGMMYGYTVAINVLLSFNFAVVFNFNVFLFPPSKEK
jgi:hypothetical protein